MNLVKNLPWQKLQIFIIFAEIDWSLQYSVPCKRSVLKFRSQQSENNSFSKLPMVENLNLILRISTGRFIKYEERKLT
jgi:hypothetical protein